MLKKWFIYFFFFLFSFLYFLKILDRILIVFTSPKLQVISTCHRRHGRCRYRHEYFLSLVYESLHTIYKRYRYFLTSRHFYQHHTHTHTHTYIYIYIYCSVGWGCKIHWLLLFRGVRPHSNECSQHDIKSDGEVPVLIVLWEMWSTPSLQLLPGPLWPGVIATDKVLSLGQIELNHSFEFTVFAFKLRIYAKLNCLK